MAVRVAYALAPRQALRYQLAGNAELTNPDHPDRPILFLAFRLARLFSLAGQLATVLLISCSGLPGRSTEHPGQL